MLFRISTTGLLITENVGHTSSKLCKHSDGLHSLQCACCSAPSVPGCSRVCRHWPSGRQIRTVLSSLAEAIRPPSSLQAALYTRAVCPTSSAMHSPENVQTRRVWSWDADTTPILGSRAKPLQQPIPPDDVRALRLCFTTCKTWQDISASAAECQTLGCPSQ